MADLILNFSNQEVKLDKNSIFLAGPTRRNSSYEKSWRKEAVEILKTLGYSGVIYIPEYSPDQMFDPNYIKRQTFWEWKALDNAGVIVFWIPRELPDMPAFTTNVEFGRYITKKPEQIVLGYPENACKMRYIELLYNKETNQVSENTLKNTLEKALKILNFKEDEK